MAIAEITDPGMENQNFDDIQRQGFYVHTFDYFSDDEISFEEGTPLSMSVGEPAVVYGSQVEETEELSNLSKNTSYAINVGGSASVGFVDAMPMLKNNSIGVNYHYSYDINNQKTQIIDLNGDGVVDRVEKNGDIIKFYKGYISDGNYVSFVDRPHSLTIPRLGKSASKTNSVGIELFFNQFVKGQIGGNYSMTKTINSDYFLDVNGDGFVDFVSGNTVYINFPDNEGIPQFTDWENDPEQRSRYDQCYKFEYDGNVDMSMEPDKKEAKRDAVVLWRNPLPMGHPFHIYFKVADYTHDEYGTRGSCVMGYNVYKADSLLFYSEEYPFQDARFYKDCGIHEYNVFIPKDGHILFHVHSNSEETIDIFNAFSIEIIPRYPLIDEHTPQQIVNYVGQIGANSTDADDKPLLHYEYNADAVVQDGSAFYSTFDGEVNFSVSLHATRPKSDTLEFFVVHNKHNDDDTYTRVVLEEYSEIFLSNDNVQDIPSVEIINASLPVAEQDQLLFELRSNSNVDWSDISFSSSVKYVGENVQDRETYHPSLNMSIYSNQLCMSRPYNLRPGRYIVTPNSELVNHLRSNNQDAEIYLTVKTLNQNKVKRLLLNGQEELSFTLPRGRDFYNVYFDYTIKNINSEFAEDDEEYDYYANSKVAVRNASSNVPLSYFAGLYAKHPAKKIYMGGNMYRGWGQFSYLDTLIVKTPVDVQEGITPDGVAEIYPYEAIPFHLFNFDKIYATEDELNNITANCASSELAIYVGNLRESNRKNEVVLKDGNYLVVTSNGESLSSTADTIYSGRNAEFYVRSLKEWKIATIGQDFHMMPVNLKLKYENLSDTLAPNLFIVRTDSLTYMPGEMETFAPDSADADGYYYYNNIKWDTDGSGFDRFSFGTVFVDKVLEEQIEQEIAEAADGYTNSDFGRNDNTGNGGHNNSDSRLDGSIDTRIMGVDVFPNPCYGDFVVTVDLADAQKFNIRIVGVDGKLIWNSKIDGLKHYEVKKHIEMSGTYLIEVSTAADKLSKTIVVY